ncbi:hypothetical protein AVEN_131824-1 [Araneus ventricosus]|uniref:Mos1 transposase HTH domain-containing protein n=1 Tax=Araneus ventricosus TaxID=182803 RepID=A0A4Y2SWL9_ARAVE|nr:hypothetical protein AVEN_131824-1 [Araneus ventricosus]
MFETIADPADCEVRSVIRILNAKNVKPAEIHRQLVEIYGENVMTDGMVRKWVRQFNDGRTNVHDEARTQIALFLNSFLPFSLFQGERGEKGDKGESGFDLFTTTKGGKRSITRLHGGTIGYAEVIAIKVSCSRR